MAVAVAVMFTSAEVQALSNSLVTELGRKGRKGAQRRLAREGRGRDAGPPLPASACPGLPARRGRCRRPPPSPPPSPGGDREGLGAASPGTGQRRRWTCRLWPGSCPSCPPRPRCPPPPPPGSLPTSGQGLKGLQGVFAENVGVLQARGDGRRVPQAVAARPGG